MAHKRVILFVFLVLLASSIAEAQKSLTTAEAKYHLGKNATVCGEVASTHYAVRSRGNPTFINLDKPYPNQVFTVLIWGSDRSKFGDPEEVYRNKSICVTGKISEYKGIPEIVAYGPSQIKTR
jgi:DNA/RNA endonuclease YhcR with UshA esterase domain